MFRASLALVLVLALIGCGGSSIQTVEDLAGDWTAWTLIDGEAQGPNAKSQWTLRVKKDGTFEEHMETHVVGNLVQDSKGTVTVSNGTVEFKGTANYKSDDGYKKDAGQRPVHYVLTVSGDKLILKGSEPDTIEFRRVGALSDRQR